jgi:hypothetical protein
MPQRRGATGARKLPVIGGEARKLLDDAVAAE